MRVLAALSGGVDSAVAAARLVDAGHEVVGVHLALSRTDSVAGGRGRGCCTLDDARDARRAADVLGIPCYVWDLSDAFAAAVLEPFVASYAAGRTPNPCVACNRHVKFAALDDRARALGFDAVATGHYARLERAAGSEGGAGVTTTLHRAADRAKDQSYVLAVLTPERLARALFPLGDAAAKADVRAEAAARGLGVADKADSTDVCFIPDGDTRTWLGARIARRPGAVLDTAGAVVGRHDGAHAFTLGQRRGLALDRPAPDGRPRYVVATDVAAGTVTVGGADDLLVEQVVASGPLWCGPAPRAGDRVGVQLRAHAPEVPARVAQPDGARIVLALEQAVAVVAPGQLAALYDGDRVVGSATVERCGAPSPVPVAAAR